MFTSKMFLFKQSHTCLVISYHANTKEGLVRTSHGPKEKINLFEDEIAPMVEETEARLNRGLTNVQLGSVSPL